MSIRSANGIVYFETVDGEEKMFKLDFNAIADLEALLGMGIGNIINEQNIGFNIIRAFYWAGLKFRDKKMTVTKAGKFIQKELNGGRGFDEMMEPVTEAMIASGIIDRKDVEEAEQDLESEEDEVEDEKN